MDEKAFKETLARFKEAADVLNKLPPEVRLAAFNLLEAQPSTHTSPPGKITEGSKEQKAPVDVLETKDAETFFTTHEHGKPADNAKLIAAYLYSQYGSEPFSLEEIRALSRAVGITIPSRIDATFATATEGGKKLFHGHGRGLIKPTVHGEEYMKSNYKVRTGTKKRTEPLTVK